MGTVLSGLTSSSNVDWSLLPEPIFDEIMLIIGLKSPESLDICKQVCKAWRKRIMKNLMDSPSKNWRPVIERRMEKSCLSTEMFPSDEKLAYVKLLGNIINNERMKKLDIFNIQDSQSIGTSL